MSDRQVENMVPWGGLNARMKNYSENHGKGNWPLKPEPMVLFCGSNKATVFYEAFLTNLA